MWKECRKYEKQSHYHQPRIWQRRTHHRPDGFQHGVHVIDPHIRDLVNVNFCVQHEPLEIFKAILHNSKRRYGERGAAAAGAVLEPLGGNYAVLP